MDVRLEKIGEENFGAVVELELEKDQEQNLPSNVYSIAESSLSASFHPRAIVAGDTVVGFAMYQFGEVGKFDEGECTIWRFMIDRRHQNKGIGKAIMPRLIEEIKAHNLCHMIEIYYDQKNEAAVRLYGANGFKVVARRDDGDLIAEIRFED